MWLFTSLLVLVLCLPHCQAFQCSTSPYTNQIPEFTICSADNRTDHSHNDVTDLDDCDYSSVLPLVHCESPDPSTAATLCWRLRDSATGTVEVAFPLLPSTCNFTGYDVTLMVYEANNCPANEEDFKKHSRKEITIKDCAEASCMDQCSQTGKVVFRHIFSACYQLYVTPKRHYQAFQELVAAPLVLVTAYNKTPVSTIQSPVLHLTWDVGLSMQAQFPMRPASSYITLIHGINTAAGLHACRNTGITLATCATCLGSPDIQCKTTNSGAVTPTCSYQGESIVRCKFLGLKPGNYCVRIQFDDERCVADTVWDNDNYSACTWEVFQPLMAREQAVEVFDNTPLMSSVNQVLLTLLIVVIVAGAFLIGCLLYRRMLPSYPEFLPVRHKPQPLSDKPMVLLLYARDCAPFMQAVTQLRSVIRRLYNCQVLDYWEDSQYDSVAQGPSRWLLSLLTNPRVRVVLVTSPASALQEAALIQNTAAQYRQPRAFDCVFTHALTFLHETVSQDSYKRLFVVRLDNGAEGEFFKVRTYLNPLTTYVLPVHFNKLMATIHNLDSAVCTITADGQTELVPLTEAISEYRRYLRGNPQYLENILVADVGTTVQHILV